MTVVSSKEFKNHQDKYLELAINERVFIKKGNHTFFISIADLNDELEDIIEYRNAKTHKSDTIPFKVAFEEIEAFIRK